MTACQAVPPGRGYPGWVAPEIRSYLDHVERGLPLRRLAAVAGCHGSTVLRQIRKLEARRDDPLVDEALSRLARARPDPTVPQARMTEPMTLHSSLDALVPDDATLAREARRLLRRLAEPGACLAVAPGMEKAVIVRETGDGRQCAPPSSTVRSLRPSR